jgi:hypothetical protein
MVSLSSNNIQIVVKLKTTSERSDLAAEALVKGIVSPPDLQCPSQVLQPHTCHRVIRYGENQNAALLLPTELIYMILAISIGVPFLDFGCK